MDQDGADRVGFLVRPEVEQVVRHRPPHAHRLVRLAGVGLEGVLEGRIDRLGHVGVGDGNVLVVHGRPFWAPPARQERSLRFLTPLPVRAVTCFSWMALPCSGWGYPSPARGTAAAATAAAGCPPAA